MGAAIMRFINRLNIQTSWLKKKKKLVFSFKVDSKIPPSWAQEGFLVWEVEYTTTVRAQ